MSGCFMVIDWHCTPDGDMGDEIECGAPVWLASDESGYCRKHADEQAANGLDSFTAEDAAKYTALILAEKGDPT